MLKPSQLKKNVLALAGRRQERFVDLAIALKMLKDASTAAFRQTAAEAGVNLRQAYYLCEIIENFKPLSRYRDRLEAIGWTKAQVIAKYITQENAKELLEQAESKENTTRRLQAIVRGQKPPGKTHCVLLYFSPSDFKKFEKAVLQNGGTKAGRGLKHKEKAVMKLVEQIGKIA